jgi:hypothetical protein
MNPRRPNYKGIFPQLQLPELAIQEKFRGYIINGERSFICDLKAAAEQRLD